MGFGSSPLRPAEDRVRPSSSLTWPAGSSTVSPNVTAAERPDRTATAAKPDEMLAAASSAAAMAGPTSVEMESSRPRTTFAEASSDGVWHRSGSNAELTGR